MTIGRLPTVGEIQRTNATLVAVAAALVWWLDSGAAGLACLLGGAIVIVNLYALAAVARLLLSAGRDCGAAGLAMVAAPLKLLLIIGLVYLLLAWARVDVAGFAIGVLTQLGAILIETGRMVVCGAGGES